MSSVRWLIFLAIVGFAFFICRKVLAKFKIPKISCVTLVTGGVKSGKSTFSVNLAIKTYKRIHLRWQFRSYFQKLLQRPIAEEPLLYSNIPLVHLAVDFLIFIPRLSHKWMEKLTVNE